MFVYASIYVERERRLARVEGSPSLHSMAENAESATVGTPRRGKSMADRLRNAMQSVGLRSPTSHADKKKRDSVDPSDSMPATCGFVKDAVSQSVAASLTKFGECVGEQLDAVSDRLDNVNANVTKVGRRVDEVDEVVKEMQASIKALEDETTTLKEQSQQSARPVLPPTQPVTASSLHGYTNWAVLGNLGWDLNADQLLSRARQTLAEAKIEESEWSLLSCLRTPGSTVRLRFNEADALADNKTKIRVLSKVWRNDGKPVWMDAQKSDAELKPNRVLNRASSLVQQTLEAKGSSAVVEVQRGGFRRLKISGEIVATVSMMGLKWTEKAPSHLSREELDEIGLTVNSM